MSHWDSFLFFFGVMCFAGLDFFSLPRIFCVNMVTDQNTMVSVSLELSSFPATPEVSGDAEPTCDTVSMRLLTEDVSLILCCLQGEGYCL